MTAIAEPASAVAASLCAMARTSFSGTTRRHPSPCGWCVWPPEQLVAMVAEYNAAAGYDDRRGTYRRHDARAFAGRPRAEQLEAVRRAQGDAE